MLILKVLFLKSFPVSFQWLWRYGYMKCSFTWKLFIYLFIKKRLFQFNKCSKWLQSAWMHILIHMTIENITLQRIVTSLMHLAESKICLSTSWVINDTTQHVYRNTMSEITFYCPVWIVLGPYMTLFVCACYISNTHISITVENQIQVHVTFLTGNDLRYKTLKYQHSHWMPCIKRH